MGTDWVAVLAILAISVAVIALGWERPPIPLILKSRSRDWRSARGLKGAIQGLNEEVRTRLMAHVGGELPEGVTSQRFLALKLLTMSVAVLLLLWMGFGGIALVGGGVAGYIVAMAYADAAASKRRKQLNAQVLAAAEIMQDVIQATGRQAMDVLADAAKRLGFPLYEEIGPLLGKAASGEAIGDAIVEVQERTAGSPLLVQLLSVLREIYRPTEEGRISPDKQAVMIGAFLEQAEYETDLVQEVEILSSPGRTTRWMVVAIIVGILLFQFLIQPDTMRYFLSTTFGQVSMVIVILLILAAVVLGERIARVE